MSNFHALEVVGRGSEAHLQLGKNLNTLTWRDNLHQNDYSMINSYISSELYAKRECHSEKCRSEQSSFWTT